MPFAIVDVDYHEAARRPGSAATAACLVVERWTDAAPFLTHVVEIPEVLPYAPGRFFERELPCILAVLAKVRERIDTVVIDGYVQLDTDGTAGLGAHLHAHEHGRFAVVGVAKNAYGDGSFARAVLRGGSKKPLYVTAMGVDVELAARRIEAMHGRHRIPTLLGWVDRLAAGDPPAWPA
ncbi:MAG: endonuclease V [Deltaproteobacteria bacterium]|nr:endonuclease V [Deltaproteobacteria bacterium]MBK8716167.1 endonuclease V [Deltaproteobacteria bacterium]MBP7292097.1 endonuclease V [Nannocystaceae bacterium]